MRRMYARCAPRCWCSGRAFPPGEARIPPARRMRHRPAADRSAPQGHECARREGQFDHGGVTLPMAARRGDLSGYAFRRRDGKPADGGDARQRHDTHRKRAKEPEIVDLAAFLNAMGARICGAGHIHHRHRGRSGAARRQLAPISDRIEAGTMACACAITGGELLLSGARRNTCARCSSSSAKRAYISRIRRAG